MAGEQEPAWVPQKTRKVLCPYCEKLFAYVATDVTMLVRKSLGAGTRYLLTCPHCGATLEVDRPEDMR